MDPNTTLAKLREAVIQLGRLNTPDAPDDVHTATSAVLERWSALDTWLSNGGFPPAQWGNLTTRDAVGDVQRELEPDPWRRYVPPTISADSEYAAQQHGNLVPPAQSTSPRGAYDDPAVQRAIRETVSADTVVFGFTDVPDGD